MEGIIAAEKESGIVERQVTGAVSQSQIIEQSLRQWRRELIFLKTKYTLLERLLELSFMHFKTSPNKSKKEDLLRECSFFLTGALTDFEDKYNENYAFFECFELLSESSADEFLHYFQYLQQDWNDLQVKNQQLEFKLLKTFIKRYPVFIV